VTAWVDTHCHLQLLDNAAAAVAGATASGVVHLVCVGIDLATSKQAVAFAEAYPQVHATVGLHPHDASSFAREWDELCALAAHPAVVAIGECGFDFYRNLSPHPDQARAFRAQIKLAKQLGKPLVVHTRDAWDATLPVLEDEGAPERVIFHCFSGGPAEAARCVKLGAAVSIAGPISYPKNDALREAARSVPADRLVVETDAPFLSPQKFRGKPNTPAHVTLVGEALAVALGRPAAQVAAETTATAAMYFGW
jgi:TatD DNase family protein